VRQIALTIALLFALLLSSVAGAEYIRNASADPYIPPEEAPEGYRIRSDGTFDVPNLHRDNNTYTLTGNVEGNIVIERDNIVLDGSNYTLHGNGSSIGVWLQDKKGVTIKNLNVQHFAHGIRFSHYSPDWHSGQPANPTHVTNCTVEACRLTNNEYGISFYLYTSNCYVLRNYIAHNTFGVYLAYCSDNIFRKNTIEKNKYNFWEFDENINNVDSSNTINGKPIYYWVNVHNIAVPSNAGLVILKYCSGVRVQNSNLSGNGNGISLYYTTNSEIYGNTISDNYWRGIAVWWSSNNSIIGNKITNTANDGIEEYESSNNTLSHNLISGNELGIYHRTPVANEVISSNQIIDNQRVIFGDSINCTITDNYIFGNQGDGVQAGADCVVTRNNITQNTGTGIRLGFNNSVKENYVSNNDVGISLQASSTSYRNSNSNTVISNTFVGNGQWAIQLRGPVTGNLFYSNNFIGHIQVIPDRSDNRTGVSSWDNGAEGNYWSDYNSTQTGENAKVGTTPYHIDENNQDNYPLLAPKEFAALELPSIEPPTPAESISAPQNPIITIESPTDSTYNVDALTLSVTIKTIKTPFEFAGSVQNTTRVVTYILDGKSQGFVTETSYGYDDSNPTSTVTFVGSASLSELKDGPHNLTVHAEYDYNPYGIHCESESTVYFMIDTITSKPHISPVTFPMTIVIAISVVIGTVAGASILVAFRKRSRVHNDHGKVTSSKPEP